MKARVGILGTGWGVRVQVPALRHAGLEVAGLWARSPRRATEIAGALGIPFATADPRALFARDDIDLVTIVTPPHTHAELALAALEAGKHVLCEKPFALDAAQAGQLVAAASGHPGRLALVDHELRFLPARLRMRQLVRAGYLGEPLHFAASFSSGGRLGSRQPWDWWSQSAQGGGALGAVGSHLIDQVTWLLGRRVVAVQADLATLFPQRPDRHGKVHRVDSDEYFRLGLRLEGELPGSVGGSAAVAGPPLHRLLLAGSEGTLRIEGGRLLGCPADRRTPEDLTLRDPLALPQELPDTEWSRATLHFGRAIAATLHDGDHAALEPAATFTDGLAVQRVIDAARLAHDEGRWVRIDS